MNATMQEKVCKALEVNNDWCTVGEVARRLGVKPNTTIRVILDTLVFCGLVKKSWGWTGKQNAAFYKKTWKRGERIGTDKRQDQSV